MSEVNYRRNGMKYSTTGKCWGMAPVKVPGAGCLVPGAKGPNPPSQGYGGLRPKSSRERRAAKKGK